VIAYHIVRKFLEKTALNYLNNYRARSPDEYIMLSLDVTLLFTNIPLDLALLGIKNRWLEIIKKTELLFEEFISVTKFVLSSSFFTFEGKIFK